MMRVPPMPNDRHSKCHDVTPKISPRLAVFPGDTAFQTERLMSFAQGDHLELSRISGTVHLGAHADSPLHYHPQGQPIDERDPMLYIGRAQLIEVRLPRGERILPAHLSGKKIEASRVLFRTGSFPDPNRWNSDFNSLSTELIESLAGQGVRLVGIDTPSVDPADDRELLTHQALYRHDFAVLEGLVLDGIREGIYTLVAPPLKIAGGDAAPVRALLIEGEIES